MTLTPRRETYKTLPQILMDEPLPLDNSLYKITDYIRRLMLKISGARILKEVEQEGGTNHSNLTNLDYAGSGHSGFQATIGSTLYLGDENTNGSWRVTISGTGLNFERRESGSWIKKGGVTA